MKRKFLIAISIILITIAGGNQASAQSRLQDLQVTIPVRFITLQTEFIERIGVDFDFPATKDRFKSNSGFGAGIGGGILFPDVAGNTDFSIEGILFRNGFGADEITNQNGFRTPVNGDVTDTGVGADFAALIELIEVTVNPPTSGPGRVALPDSIDLKISAGGGIVNRDLDIDFNGIPFVNDSATVLFGQVGAGLQFPLSILGLSDQAALYVGVNHRVTGGLDLRTNAGVPFRMARTSSTSVRANLIIFITPRIIQVTEQED
ncbi:MAG: hypothetical protein K8F25_19155 [Fimbriimonadaceae bacterium]|nr:hypothetical protein [Alphaproteobacteria bacterium]